MQIYNPNKTSITLSGISYAADENGIIGLPDDKVSSSVWTQGFVHAKGRLAELAALTAEPLPTPDPETNTPVAATTSTAKPKTTSGAL